LNPQAALDAPRWQWIKDKTIYVEKSVSREIVEGLIAKGHDVKVVDDVSGFGRGEIIWRDKDGVLCGATEPRADGTVASW
jgi:gamma-glutamyltranspeptidase/glutathione hydrolase